MDLVSGRHGELAFREWGNPGAGVTLVCLHGFTHTGVSWSGLAQLMPDVRIIAPDLPGHGGKSVSFSGGMKLASVGEMVNEFTRLTSLPDVSTHIIGYSLGGRIAFHSLLADPNLYTTAIVVGASPGIESVKGRQERLDQDRILAGRLESEGLDAFLSRWEAMPMFRNLSKLPSEDQLRLREMRRSHDPIQLAQALRELSVGGQEYLVPQMAGLNVPILYIAGEEDKKFVDVGTSLAAQLPECAFRSVAGAGHAVHLEAPQVVARLISAWLSAVRSR